MGIKERKQRVKDKTRNNIIKAALKIVKEEGWQALSMRKIAELIEYSAPVIYEYFANKDAILSELNKKGFQRLAVLVNKASKVEATPEKQLENMWMAYWDFAFKEKEYYQLMFGVDTQCCADKANLPDNENPSKMFVEVIKSMMGENGNDDDLVMAHYITLWSVVHGLVAINLVNQGSTKEINSKVLLDALHGVIRSLLA